MLQTIPKEITHTFKIMPSSLETRIHLLPKEVIEQIAAGEVVERPASVVKELVENALDAKASNIQVELEKGGKDLIRVSDNGYGMSQDEISLAIKRHATSKLSQTSDLFNLTTFGFRGEALPSIAAVSKMEIRSRPAYSEEGKFLRIEGGNVIEEGAIGMAPGTIITITDLYYNLPARLKFLRSTTTEEAHSIDVLSKLALSAINTRFQVFRQNRQIFMTPAGQERLTRVALLYPQFTPGSFLAVNTGNEEISLEGLIIQPGAAKGTKQAITLFVNGRVVRPGLVAHAVMEGYRHYLQPRIYPVSFLFLNIPGDSVDINVHPTKAEVRFGTPQKIFAFIEKSIRETISASLESGANPLNTHNEYFPSLLLEEQEHYAGSSAPYRRPSACSYEHSQLFNTLTPIHRYNYEETKQEPNIKAEASLIGELANTYLVFQDQNTIYLVDQHQAHERSTYEALHKKMRNREELAVQPLLFPISITVSPLHFTILEKYAAELASIGFQIEPFGGNTILLRSIPHGLDKFSQKEVFCAFLDDLFQYEEIKEADIIKDKIITSLACKSSVKAGDTLAYEEKLSLWKKLMETDNPYLCPHGRPIMIKFPLEELHRLFKRK